MSTDSERQAVRAVWDAEYASGRYAGEPRVPFVDDVLAFAREDGVSEGLYIGCGNGRNYVPLVDGGLDLVGLDVSWTAVRQLATRMPERRRRLVVGDTSSLGPHAQFEVIVAIQVFQHGRRSRAHAHVRAAVRHVAPMRML